MNQESHNVGDIHIEDDHGMAWLMRKNVVGCDKIVFDSVALSKSTLAVKAPVMHRGKIVGMLHSKQYNRLDGFLVGFFSLRVSRDSLPDSDFLYAVPKYEFEQIQCVRCQRFFRRGTVACECIEESPVLQIPKITITGVLIYNGLNDDIHMRDARRDILTQHFGGVVASINLDNEEF